MPLPASIYAAIPPQSAAAAALPLIRELAVIAADIEGMAQLFFHVHVHAIVDRVHHEIVSYGGDTELMYKNLTSLTEHIVSQFPTTII